MWHLTGSSPSFIDPCLYCVVYKESKAQRGQASCLRSHNKLIARSGFQSPDSQCHVSAWANIEAGLTEKKCIKQAAVIIPKIMLCWIIWVHTGEGSWWLSAHQTPHGQLHILIIVIPVFSSIMCLWQLSLLIYMCILGERYPQKMANSVDTMAQWSDSNPVSASWELCDVRQLAQSEYQESFGGCADASQVVLSLA